MTRLSDIRLVCLDLDDTLWPCTPTIINAERAIYTWLQQHQPAIAARYSIDQLRDKRKALLKQQPELRNDLSEARRVHLKELADEQGLEHDWIEDAFQVFYRARQEVNLYHDVLPSIEFLAARKHLVALTNGNAHIDHVGIQAYFRFQLSAADLKAAKPDPAMFHVAMEKLGLKPEQVMHVGDHPRDDILGAQNAGITSVWLNRSQQEWEQPDFRPDYQISDLHQLLELLYA